jgi:Family of unknown function (DUF5696)
MNLAMTVYLQQLEMYDKALAVVHVYDIYHYRTVKVAVSLKDCEIEKVADGYDLKVKCSGQGVAFDIEMRAGLDRLKIRIPYESIVEEKSYYWRLEGVEILPEFMAQPYGAEGYLLWPNYSGVSCCFDKTEAVEFCDVIYGANNRWENFTSMSIFGKVGGDEGFLCIISSGQFECELIHRLAQGVEKMHSTTPLFRFRMDPRQKIDAVDRTLEYVFFEGEKNNFVEMAKTYRQFLLEERKMRTLKEKCLDSKELEYAASSQWLKIFCGDKKSQLDGLGKFTSWTTFAQAKEILQALIDRGIDKITCMLVGWNQEGHDGRFPDRLPPEPELGGEVEMKKLVQWGRAQGLQMVVHDNFVDGFERAEYYSKNGVMRDYLGFVQVVGVWSGGESHRLKPEYGLRDAKRDLPILRDEIGLSGMYYLDAISLGLEPDFSDLNNIKTRRDFALGQLAILDETKRVFGSVQNENNFDYLFDASDACASVVTFPYRTKTFQTDICRNMNNFLPFFNIAWHGLVLYHHTDLMQFVQQAKKNPYKLVLQELSWGALGRIELTYKESLATKGFACIEDNKILDIIGQQYNLLNKKAAYLQFELIENYEQIDTECFVTTFSDGSQITVDYQTLSCKIIDGRGKTILNSKCSDLQLNQAVMA